MFTLGSSSSLSSRTHSFPPFAKVDGYRSKKAVCPLVFVSQKVFAIYIDSLSYPFSDCFCCFYFGCFSAAQFVFEQWHTAFDHSKSKRTNHDWRSPLEGLQLLPSGRVAIGSFLQHQQRWRFKAIQHHRSDAVRSRSHEKSSLSPFVYRQPYLWEEASTESFEFKPPSKALALNALQAAQVVDKKGDITSPPIHRGSHLTWVVRMYQSQERQAYDLLWGLAKSLAACDGDCISLSIFLLDTEIGHSQPNYLEKCKTFFRSDALLDVHTFRHGEIPESFFLERIQDGGCSHMFMGQQAHSSGQLSGNCRNFAQYMVTDKALSLALLAIPETTHIVVTNADNLYSVDFVPVVNGILNDKFLKDSEPSEVMIAMDFYHHSAKMIYPVSDPLIRKRIDLGAVILPAFLFTSAKMSFIKTLPTNASEVDAHDADGFFIEAVQHRVSKIVFVSQTLFYHL